MDNFNKTDEFFFDRNDISVPKIEKIVADALKEADDGELFLEYCQSEGLSFDDNRLKAATFDTMNGFGLRFVSNEATGYAHASELSEKAIKRAALAVNAVKAGDRGSIDVSAPRSTNASLYMATNPLGEFSFENKVNLLEQMNDYARSLDKRISQFSASISGEWQAIQIIRGDKERLIDIRPLVRINVSVVCQDNGRMEAGSHGVGGRVGYGNYFNPTSWKNQINEAYRQAMVNLDSSSAPAGEMDVVLGPGWPGILLHEAIGHGLEGDFNRKKTSAFSGLLGERIASPGVTVVDNGAIMDKRGSISIDDEGTPSSNTILIEDGILKNYMHDRLNARLMGMAATGNGRRESFAHAPMPRMTNTYMHAGTHDPEEIINSVKKGLYAVNFGGGQVDITSGKFVFSAAEAYQIEDGKIGKPVKGATLIGDGPAILKQVKMIGNDLKLDPGIGTCGKDGQGVPVGVGQPTILVQNLTVGGTET
tara:strand:+ start:172 stop:1608 length:1437 start_codon:yes stop_codon:yes gene_type:complete